MLNKVLETSRYIFNYWYITTWKVSVFGVFLVRIQSKWGKIQTRKTPNTDTCHAVQFLTISWIQDKSSQAQHWNPLRLLHHVSTILSSGFCEKEQISTTVLHKEFLFAEKLKQTFFILLWDITENYTTQYFRTLTYCNPLIHNICVRIRDLQYVNVQKFCVK